MRRIAHSLIGAAALALLLASPGLVRAGDPVKPEIGSGPHRDRSGQTSGAGEKPRQPGASVGPSHPEDERMEREREEDEKKATESKEKMKKKPGYKDEVPSPRAQK